MVVSFTQHEILPTRALESRIAPLGSTRSGTVVRIPSLLWDENPYLSCRAFLRYPRKCSNSIHLLLRNPQIQIRLLEYTHSVFYFHRGAAGS